MSETDGIERSVRITGALAHILFQIVTLYRVRRKLPVRLPDIVAKLDSTHTEATVRAVAPKLKHAAFPGEQSYVNSDDDGYVPNEAAFITTPRTANYLLSILNAEEQPVDKDAFISWASATYRWKKGEEPSSLLARLIEHHYCEEDNLFNSVSVPTGKDSRYFIEKSYIELLAGSETYPNCYSSSPRSALIKNDVSIEQDGVRTLAEQEVSILDALWLAVHRNKEPHVPQTHLTPLELSQRTGLDRLTVDEALSILHHKKLLKVTYSPTPQYGLDPGLVQWPPSAIMLCDLMTKTGTPPDRTAYIKEVSKRLLRQDFGEVEKEIFQYTAGADYVEPAKYTSHALTVTDKAREHAPWLHRLKAKLDLWLTENSRGEAWAKQSKLWLQTRHRSTESQVFDKKRPRLDETKQFPQITGNLLRVFYALAEPSLMGEARYQSQREIKAVIDGAKHWASQEISLLEIEEALDQLFEEYPIRILDVGSNCTYRRWINTSVGWPCSAHVLKIVAKGNISCEPYPIPKLIEDIEKEHYRTCEGLPPDPWFKEDDSTKHLLVNTDIRYLVATHYLRAYDSNEHLIEHESFSAKDVAFVSITGRASAEREYIDLMAGYFKQNSRRKR